MTKNVVILGAGGFAREVLDIFDAYTKTGQRYKVLGYIIDSKFGSPGTLINQKPILGDFIWLSENKENIYAICGVGDPVLRKHLVERALKLDVSFINAIHPSATLTPWVNLGVGVVITAGCRLTNQIIIGNHVQINLNSTIGHNSKLDDYVTIAPGTNISGNVSISKGSYIGTGVNIIEKINIAEWSIIGAGSTIIRDIPPNTTVVGSPGKIIKEREAGWHLRLK